ncbi:iron-containing redox enzyme family protein [Burkholderia sp. FL-7-2-10-S1-D7]|uniref:iron-containing redox enzyme family protein n=1 Tax=Burkholderia sp. FL-7-2-10-S1-D7 TaxID=1637866 RepID=UPI000AFF63F2|nr:iron-containing redox enzyme family protein [Burkholderia sp. FL-7-2-10-S1-D7]
MNPNRVLSNEQTMRAEAGVASEVTEPPMRSDAVLENAVDICRAILNSDVDPYTASIRAERYIRKQQAVVIADKKRWPDELAHLPNAEFEQRLDDLATACAPSELRVVDGTDETVRFVLSQCVPRELLRGALLQNFCNASNSHEVVASLVHRIHALQVGEGKVQSNSANRYRLLLSQYGLDLPDVSSERFFAYPDVIPSSWHLPAYQLSLSLFPKRFEAEIFGAALFDASEIIASPLQALAGDRLSEIGRSLYIKQKFSIGDELNRIIREVISRSLRQTVDACHPDDRDAAAATYRWRILLGFRTSAMLSIAWREDLQALLNSDYLGPRHAMVRLIQRKGVHAVGYHERLKVGEIPFDSLIVDDPVAFVRGLERSRWIAPGHPDKSLLITKLIEFGGPMFRVFSDPEIDTIRRWIAAIPADLGKGHDDAHSVDIPLACPARGSSLHVQGNIDGGVDVIQIADKARFSPRTLYTKLLNHEHDPVIYHEARQFVKLWLARSGADLTRDEGAIPFDVYSHEKLRSWFDDKAASQLKSYEESERTIQKTREEVIDEALQLCPMIFIDGAWLQKWGNAGLVETDIGSHLFKIYADEIGNGNFAWNHPNIYRALIGQMGVELPDFRTREFVEWQGFRTSAFEVPVFWLSISLFPRAYLPETLGLNLAMELSGVGGSYKTAHDELRHYGFSTLFVDLHNTIDNVSTGHSALALEAIALHMDQVVRNGDARSVAERWRRVWTGYRALTPRGRKWTELFKPAVYAY